MPLSKVGKRTLAAMKEKYGPDKGESVFYAAMNKGTISRDTMEKRPKKEKS
jgi:hypothetical protein